MKLTRFNFTVLTVCLAMVSGTSAVEAAVLTVIADGLNNARGISFGPDGSIYVGETGIGGNRDCLPSTSSVDPICAGNTGSVTKISPSGQQQRIFNNFDSLALQPSGNQGSGPQGLEFDSKGNAYLLAGYATFPGNRDPELSALAANVKLPPLQYVTAPPLPPDQVLNTPGLAQLYKADLNTGELTSIFDFGKYEILNNPDGGDIITNPYDLTIEDDTAHVVDASGNAVYSVKLDGSNVKVTPMPRQIIDNPEFPPLPPGVDLPGLVGVDLVRVDTESNPETLLQSVPTGVAVGPDGDLYVGEYTGFPYPEGSARIFRIGDDAQPEVYADGFTHITDLTFDENGNLLVLQFSDRTQWKGQDIQSLPGSLIQVAPDGTRTTLVAAGEGLESPTSIAVGPDNQIYVTNHGVGPEQGQVVRVAVPEPSSFLGVLALGSLGFGSLLLKRKRQQLAA